MKQLYCTCRSEAVKIMTLPKSKHPDAAGNVQAATYNGVIKWAHGQ